jgi:hypothetical protein
MYVASYLRDDGTWCILRATKLLSNSNDCAKWPGTTPNMSQVDRSRAFELFTDNTYLLGRLHRPRYRPPSWRFATTRNQLEVGPA